VRASSFCGYLIDKASSRPPSEENQISQVFVNVDKHEVVRPGGQDYLAGPFVLCKGWAYRFYRFPDGRRQILSILIPGDLFSAFALLDTSADYSVQAVTDIEICQLGRNDVKREIAADESVCDAFGEVCSSEMDDASAEMKRPDSVGRIAGFVQRIVKRLDARGIEISAGVYPFPLSSTEIADATGLTPGDVNRALQNLHESLIIDISNDVITVLDSARLENTR
jgi:CRP-like cAMP-binding protein